MVEKKYYKKKDGSYDYVELNISEEKQLRKDTIKKYSEIIQEIRKIIPRDQQEYVPVMFEKIATPFHYIIEKELLEKINLIKKQ